jgi:uncharacterized protein
MTGQGRPTRIPRGNMGQDRLRYDQMVEDALRGVVRKALEDAAASGLPGDHHFYITFQTTHPGVSLSASLRAGYPNDMTIVLQHQFWGLEVGTHSFAVTLSFGGRNERITIPFEAVTAFADPSVRFGLRFEGEAEAGDGEEGAVEAAGNADSAETEPDGATTTDGAAAVEGGAKIVTLESFRKK